MSSYFVEKATIDATVSALRALGIMSLDQANKLGRQLWLLNAEAMQQRYNLTGTQELADYQAEAEAYVWEPRSEALPVLVKSMDCLLYQCAEGTVGHSEAFKALQVAADHLRPAEATTKSPWPTAERRQYDAAPWGMQA